MSIDTLHNPSVGGSSEAMNPNLNGFDPDQIADIGAALNGIAAGFVLGDVAPEATSDMLVPRVTDSSRTKHSGCRDCE